MAFIEFARREFEVLAPNDESIWQRMDIAEPKGMIKMHFRAMR